MRELRVIKILMSISVIILSSLGLLNIINMKITLPISLFLLGILNISNGYGLYNKKKLESTLLISSGIFVIFVSVYTTFIYINL